MTLAAELVDLIAADPDALARLREIVGDGSGAAAAVPIAPVFTVQTLAEHLGRTERSIRAAIARGELAATKRGRGYVITAEAVADWAQAPARTDHAPSPGRRCSRAASGAGPMARGLR